jgi:hypothetical protein
VSAVARANCDALRHHRHHSQPAADGAPAIGILDCAESACRDAVQTWQYLEAEADRLDAAAKALRAGWAPARPPSDPAIVVWTVLGVMGLSCGAECARTGYWTPGAACWVLAIACLFPVTRTALSRQIMRLLVASVHRRAATVRRRVGTNARN